jgi:hypothetical protein
MAAMMPGDPRLRASDADRERTSSLLREHHAVGRLTAEEFGDRLEKVFTARTLGELDALLADMPAIDLYQLPSAGIRPVQGGAARSRRGEGAGVARRGDGTLLPQQVAAWVSWSAASSVLLVVWLGVGIVAGGLAWLPWFLLIVIPWGLMLARRSQEHP